MIFELDKVSILNLVYWQVDNNFTITDTEKKEIVKSFDIALSACEKNFAHSDNKYFSREINGVKESYFNPFHSVQWMIFLYYLGNSIYRNGGQIICDKLYYLNKLMNGVDMFYAIELPVHFGAEHPIGSVMGRAKYSDGFFFYQGCTVGGTRDKEGNINYPIIEENVHMYSNSSILGRSHIGRNVNVGAGCIIKNQDVPDNCSVFGQSPNLIIKHKR